MAGKVKGRGRALRIAVVLGGKIVDEKLVDDRRPVTLGQSTKNLLSVPLEELPPSWTLFPNRDGVRQLCITESMTGTIDDGGRTTSLQEFRQRYDKDRGQPCTILLGPEARGKISVGDMTLLFQIVAAPKASPPPPLPAAIRGTLADRIDPMLAIVMAVSLLIHFSVGMYAYQRDRVVSKRTSRIYNETFQRPTVSVAEIEFQRPVTPPEPEKTEVKEEQPQQKSDENPGKKTARKSRARGGNGGSARSAEEALKLQEQAQAFATRLLADTVSEGGLVGGASDRGPEGDLGEAMASLRQSGAQVAIGSGSGRAIRGGSRVDLGTGQGPGVAGPGETTVATATKTRERVPSGRIKVGGSSTIDDTTLTPNAVLRKLQNVYMNGLKRCQKDLLKRDPNAGGTVNLRFTVGETGRVVRVKVRGFDPGVDRCIEQRAQSWRFGVPKDEDGDPTEASFQISLALQPD